MNSFNATVVRRAIAGRLVGHLVFCLVCTTVISAQAQTEAVWAQLRQQMVQRHLVSAGINNPRVLESMAMTPRHYFVAPQQQRFAYDDFALPIGQGQTISPPFVVAHMTQMLEPKPTDKVLEIGTGSGYQAAVLSPLVAEVYSIEIVEALGRRAATTLQRLGYRNIITKVGDGFKGWEEYAPFDKIIVTCSPEDVPQPLVDQLADGGTMIIPLGERYRQTLYRMKKVNGKLEKDVLEATFFVPMTGEAEENRQKLPDPNQPLIVNGGFEVMLPDTKMPDGWYYFRGGKIEREVGAPQGANVLTFTQGEDMQPGNALQAFGADGRAQRQLEIVVSVRGQDAVLTRPDEAHMAVEFFDDVRAPVGQQQIGQWSGTFDWTEHRTVLNVPPRARLAVLYIGYTGATGQLSFDNVRLEIPVEQERQRRPRRTRNR